MKILGIDIGGSGMKGALVDAVTGEMLTKRHRIPTPEGRKPKDMARVVNEIAEHFNHKGPIGVGFPATGLPVTVLNDADAAGFASINYGIGKGKMGLVVMITIGTGLGSGAFLNGELIPNFELGQIPYKKYKKIELWAADSAKEREELSYEKWGKRFNTFLEYVELIICPDFIILGGGTSKDFDEYKDCITIKTPVVPATLKNQAGIIGAAAAAAHENRLSDITA